MLIEKVTPCTRVSGVALGKRTGGATIVKVLLIFLLLRMSRHGIGFRFVLKTKGLCVRFGESPGLKRIVGLLAKKRLTRTSVFLSIRLRNNGKGGLLRKALSPILVLFGQVLTILRSLLPASTVKARMAAGQPSNRWMLVRWLKSYASRKCECGPMKWCHSKLRR